MPDTSGCRLGVSRTPKRGCYRRSIAMSGCPSIAALNLAPSVGEYSVVVPRGCQDLRRYRVYEGMPSKSPGNHRENAAPIGAGINGRAGSPYVGNFRLFVAPCDLQHRPVTNSLQSPPPDPKATALPSPSQDTNSGPSAKTSPSGQVPRGALPRASLGTAKRIGARELAAS